LRKNKTSIVITHDLSQIESKDFVYVWKLNRNMNMKGRRVLGNFERWSKRSAGLEVSSRRSAPSIHHLPRRKSMCSSTPTMNRDQSSTSQ
jgi:hypothetical protein